MSDQVWPSALMMLSVCYADPSDVLATKMTLEQEFVCM
jgi:hypothetical protein